MHQHETRGVTLIELLAVVVVIGVIAGVTALAPLTRGTGKDANVAVRECRREALRLAAPRALNVDGQALLCLPDGQVAGAGPGQLIGRVP